MGIAENGVLRACDGGWEGERGVAGKRINKMDKHGYWEVKRKVE